MAVIAAWGGMWYVFISCTPNQVGISLLWGGAVLAYIASDLDGPASIEMSSVAVIAAWGSMWCG